MLVTKNWCEQNKISMEYLIETFKEVEDQEALTVEEAICKKYIEMQNVRRVAKWLNEDGKRLENGNKYDGQDVSEIIKKADNPFSALASGLYEYNNKLQNGNTTVNTLIKGLMKR